MAIAKSSVLPALRAALEPTVDDELLSAAPAPAKGRLNGVAVGVLVSWWFECVWPELLRRRERAAAPGEAEEDEAMANGETVDEGEEPVQVG